MGTLIAGVAGFILGLGVAWLGLRDHPHHRDQIAEALAERARDRMSGLPRPTDDEVAQMVGAAMQAPEGVPFAFPALVLGTEVLRCRRLANARLDRAFGPVANSNDTSRGQTRGQTADA